MNSRYNFLRAVTISYALRAVTLGLATFAFSTILDWSYSGEKSIEYLLGARSVRPYLLLLTGIIVRETREGLARLGRG